MIYYPETVEFYTRFWHWYLPTHSVDLSSLGALDMNLDPPFLYNPSEQKWRNQYDLSLFA